MLGFIFPLTALLIFVWLVVDMILRLVIYDTLRYDMTYLWENYDISKKDIGFGKSKQ